MFSEAIKMFMVYKFGINIRKKFGILTCDSQVKEIICFINYRVVTEVIQNEFK